ncbi:LysM peptidoglycan-binding domain-containing protein, partial [Simiduia aestuariiviva]
GGANNAESRGVEFSGLERASGASDLLTGSALADNFELLADGTISGNGILFNGIVGVNAGAGNDSAVGRSGVSWAVNGLNSAVNGGVVFNGIDALTGDSQSLLVTTGDDELQVTGLGSVNVWGMDITSTTGDGLTLVDMSTGVDTVRARAGEDFELLAGGLGVRTDGIDFINVENADNGGIYSGDSDGVFEIIGTKRIRSGEIYFNNVEEFNAEGGYDVIIGYAGEAWQILSENSAKNYEIVFINIEEIRSSSDQIYGSTGADDFVFINGSQLQVAGMEVLFTAGLSSIDGVAGEDSFQGLSGTHYLLNEDYSAVSADGIDLLNINDLQLGSSLTGRAATDEFSVSNSGQVAVAGYTFSALDSVAGNGGSDSVIFSDANTVSVDSTGAVTYTTSKDLLFSGMQAYTGSIDTLVLGADVANVDISTVGQLSLAGVTFDSSSSAPLALNVGSTATLLNYGAAPITISDVSGQIESAGVVANGVGRADANFVQGEGVVSLTVTGSGTLEAAGIDFTSVASYDGSSSSDDVFGGDIALVGSAGQLAFEGIEFTAIEQATTTTGQVFGSNQSDVVIFSADGSITANGISLTSTAASGFSTVELGDGLDRVTVSNGSASLTGNDNEFYVGSVFVSDVDIATSAAIESSVDVAFDYLSTQSLRAQNIVFDGLSSVTTNNAEGSLAGAGHIQENIDGSLTAGSMNFVGLDFVQANSLQLSSADNVIDVDASGNVTASAVRFSGLSALNTGGGTDRIHATSTNSWSISDDAHDVSLGSLGISGAEVLSGVTTLESSSAGQRVTVTGAGEVNIGAMSIRDLVEVSATGSGSIVQERQGTVWQLKDALSQVVSDSIAFSGFSEFLADDSTLVADGAAAETFAVNSDGSQLAAGNVVFGGVTQLNGQANDQLRVADNTAIALTGQSAVVTINELKSQGIKQITGEGIAIIGTAAVDNVALESGANNIYADGIHFEGVTQFDAGGGSDQLSGDNASRSYVLDSAAQVSVAGITFKGIETVNALGAEDVVSSSGADWYAQAQGGALTSKASQAVVGDVSVLFTGIETIEGVGSLYGADVGSHYQLTDLNSLVYGDITYKNVSQLVAGAANDTLRAGDTSTNWSLQAAGNTAVSGSQTLAFSGFESLQLGSGADTVVFGGGSVNRIDTGAGSDNVKLIGGSLGSLHLGAGNDHLVVVNNALAPASFFGGAGEDSLLSESGLAWSLIATDANNGLGDYRFTGFETLLDSGAAVQVATQTSNYLNGKTLASGGMSLSFDSANSLDLTAGALGAESVTGNLAIDSLVLAAAGDVNLGVTANNLSVTNLSDAIDVQLAIQGDATVKSINAGNGDILLTSSQAGSLYFEAGQENLTASNVQLGTEAQPFIAIGDELNPAVIRASDSVKFVSLSYVEPLYVGFIPTVTSFAGNRIESVYGAQAAQGVKSAVQTAVEDFAQVDPAIFEAVSPYSTSANALGGGEFRLVAGVLLPADATAAGNDEELEDNAEREQAPTQLIELPEDAVKPELKEGFESTYQIKKGDTFWDIAEKFLKNPYKWQDLWKQNPNVKNPHKIFPGDVIKVILIRGNAYLTIQAAPQSEDALCTAGWPMRAVAWVPMVTNNERS